MPHALKLAHSRRNQPASRATGYTMQNNFRQLASQCTSLNHLDLKAFSLAEQIHGNFKFRFYSVSPKSKYNCMTMLKLNEHICFIIIQMFLFYIICVHIFVLLFIYLFVVSYIALHLL